MRLTIFFFLCVNVIFQFCCNYCIPAKAFYQWPQTYKESGVYIYFNVYNISDFLVASKHSHTCTCPEKKKHFSCSCKLNLTKVKLKWMLIFSLQWFRVGRHALFGSLISFLWLFGLTLCGPLRY